MKSAYYTLETKMSDILKDNFRKSNLLELLGIKYVFNNDLSVTDVCKVHNVNPELFLHICNVYTFDDYSLDENSVEGFPYTHAIDYIIKAHDYFIKINITQIKQGCNDIASILTKRHSNIITGLMDGFLDIITEQISCVYDLFEQYTKNPKSIAYKQVESIIKHESEVNLRLDTLIKHISELSVADEHRLLVDRLKYYLIFLRNEFDRHNAIKNITMKSLCN